MSRKRKLRRPGQSQEETHQWDRLLKMLMKASPQELVSWIVSDAVYLGELNPELLKKAPISADLLYSIKWRGEKFVLHVEFQREHDTNMDRRVWEYNCLTSIYTELPVYSVVIYLLNRGVIVEPYYEIRLPTELTIHRFVFENIKLWEIPRDFLKRLKLPGLLPLLPLTQDGKSQEAVEEVIKGLEQAGRKDLLPLAYVFAAYTFDTKQEEQWLIERFNAMKGFLQDNYAYREMVKWAEEKGFKLGLEQGEQGKQQALEQGKQQGLEQGKQQGLEQGKQQGLEQAKKDMQQLVVHFVELHFPALVPLARQQVAMITNYQKLQEILDRLFMVHNTHEAQEILLAM